MITRPATPPQYAYLALCSLLLGSCIYIVARPQSLLMFRWFDAIGFHGTVSALRVVLSSVAASIPAPIVFSAPMALWVFSYCLFARAIWHTDVCRWRHLWFWSLPALAVLSEFGQAIHFLSGTFDILDLCTVALSAFIAAHFP